MAAMQKESTPRHAMRVWPPEPMTLQVRSTPSLPPALCGCAESAHKGDTG
jgi:hypothetical protein